MGDNNGGLYNLINAHEKRIAELEALDVDRVGQIKAVGKYAISLEQQLAELREILSQAHDAFVCASDGHGVNFHAYAQDIKEALEGESDE